MYICNFAIMRFKYDRSDPSVLRCCFCLHVRTGTLIFGVFQLILHLVLLGWYAISVINPALLERYNLQFPDGSRVELSHAQQGNQSSYYWDRQWTSDDKFLASLMYIGSLVMTLMLIHGTIKNKSSYLLPFFCLQVFDFCITCLTVVGYFSFIPDIKRWIAMKNNVPWKEQLLQMDDDWLMLLTIMSVVFLLFVKSYLIGMVWATYKYLSGYEENMSRMLNNNYDAEIPSTDTEMLLPPKYEDVLRMSREQPSPPPYAEN